MAMREKTALVLSGGGMFGAWQAGAWRTLEDWFEPDLIVGASAGSLNGYAIASGRSAREICDWWRRPGVLGFSNLPAIIAELMDERPLRRDYAAVLVDLFRMRPRTVAGGDVRPEHLLASCAVPGAMRPQKVDGRWYLDGGLLNPLPVWAATELGATRIIALNALPRVPSVWLAPFAMAFRAIFGHHPPAPERATVAALAPGEPLGSMSDALRWNAANVERWIEQGAADAKNISFPNCIGP
jgi:NTE family protein